jgi:hypothetical protein
MDGKESGSGGGRGGGTRRGIERGREGREIDTRENLRNRRKFLL